MPIAHIFPSVFSAIALLALATGCSTGISPQGSDSFGTSPAVAQSPVAQVSDPFAEGIKYATRASSLVQSAQTPADWDEVSKQWLQAIYWMQSVPPSSPRRAFAQKKVAEYMRYLAYAQQKATVSSRLSYPTFNSDVLDEQLGLYLSYIAAIGRPDVLIVGSSRALQGVDPTVLQQALGARGKGGLKIFNFGVNGATAQVVNFQLQQLLSPQHLPRMILWADGVRAFNNGRSDRTYNEIRRSPGYQRLASGIRPSLTSANSTASLVEYPQGSAFLQPVSDSPDCSGLAELWRKVGETPEGKLPLRLHPAIVRRMNSRCEGHQFTVMRSPETTTGADVSQAIAAAPRQMSAVGKAIDANGFFPVSTRFNPASYYRQNPRVAGRYDRDYANFQLGGSQGSALNAVAAFAQSRQIPLVVVNLPVTQDYLDPTRSLREQQFRQYMRAASVRAFLWRDLSAIASLTRNDYFQDPSHLNRYGAAAVARQLAADPNIPWPTRQQ
ncbi:hypothetical protein [Phormidium sp. CCY1219]|uniref:hypothetical protein n=1 Tax=Phormidium sp. CCY1219 TaxID=2886104 RepID=UPI002D1EF1CB|nr:hypothetical protein [Phormidium sp. CCY1219]MEB3826510.1 hypothetical protein [Phormidium sp. CCY1219]